MKRVRTLGDVVLPAMLAISLIGAAYVTLFAGQWFAFLCGVLVAAVLAVRSRPAPVQWPVSKPLEQAEDELAERPPGDASTHERLAAADARLGLLLYNVREPILYVDSDQICRDHNKAFEQALGLPASRIAGRPLREVLGEASYSCVRSAVELALRGQRTRLWQLQGDRDGRIWTYDARYIPHVGSGKQTLGIYALLSPLSAQRDHTIARSAVAVGYAAVHGDRQPCTLVPLDDLIAEPITITATA